jgi:hypothetical protein
MKNRSNTIFRLALVTALFLTATASAQQIEKIFPATTDTIVEVRNLHGQVKIHGWDKMQVRVIARPHSRAVEAHFERPASRIHIHTHLLQASAPAGERAVDYEVWAPANVHIEVELKSGTLAIENFSEDVNINTVTATVALSNLSGHTSVKTLNGSIRAERCAGRVEAETISGTVRFTDCAAHYLIASTTSGDIYYTGGLKHAGTYEFKNNEGMIELSLPADASFELSANAMQGEVSSEFPLKSRSHGRLPKRRFQNSLLGTTLSGGALVRATSFSGTIRIRRQ